MSSTAYGPGMVRVITNVQCVRFAPQGGARVYADAIMLRSKPPLFPEEPPIHDVEGYRLGCNVSTFDLRLKCPVLEYTFAAFESDPAMLGMDGNPRPVWHGGILTWSDGTTLWVVASDNERPLDIVDVGRDVAEELILRKTAEYWRGTHMPIAQWLRVETVRARLG